jgi:hypothetical protein
VTLLVGLVRAHWPGPAAALDRMLLIRSVWEAGSLAARADEDRVERLIRAHRSGTAPEALREVAAPVAEGLSALESRMAALIEDGLLDAVAGTPIRADELLWSPKSGWAVALEDEDRGSLWIHWPDRPDRTKDRVKMSLPVSRHASVAQASLIDDEVKRAHDGLLAAFARLVTGAD